MYLAVCWIFYFTRRSSSSAKRPIGGCMRNTPLTESTLSASSSIQHPSDKSDVTVLSTSNVVRCLTDDFTHHSLSVNCVHLYTCVCKFLFRWFRLSLFKVILKYGRCELTTEVIHSFFIPSVVQWLCVCCACRFSWHSLALWGSDDLYEKIFPSRMFQCIIQQRSSIHLQNPELKDVFPGVSSIFFSAVHLVDNDNPRPACYWRFPCNQLTIYLSTYGRIDAYVTFVPTFI